MVPPQSIIYKICEGGWSRQNQALGLRRGGWSRQNQALGLRRGGWSRQNQALGLRRGVVPADPAPGLQCEIILVCAIPLSSFRSTSAHCGDREANAWGRQREDCAARKPMKRGGERKSQRQSNRRDLGQNGFRRGSAPAFGRERVARSPGIRKNELMLQAGRASLPEARIVRPTREMRPSPSPCSSNALRHCGSTQQHSSRLSRWSSMPTHHSQTTTSPRALSERPGGDECCCSDWSLLIRLQPYLGYQSLLYYTTKAKCVNLRSSPEMPE